jgi:hypothetical protein
MISNLKFEISNSRREAGFTFAELMVASAIGTVLVALLLILTLYGQQSFGLMTNYSELDSKTRNTVTLLSREIRQATRVIQAQTNGSGKSLTLTNAMEGTTLTIRWDSADRILSLQKSPGVSGELLTGCDQWDYVLYDGAPVVAGGKLVFAPSATPATSKLIEMSWSCSRAVGGKPGGSSTETVRFGLRNSMQ